MADPCLVSTVASLTLFRRSRAPCPVVTRGSVLVLAKDARQESDAVPIEPYRGPSLWTSLPLRAIDRLAFEQAAGLPCSRRQLSLAGFVSSTLSPSPS